jgi:hypothetical protein
MVLSQQQYFVKDQVTLESIPFAKIYPENNSPFLADIDGAFALSNEIRTLEIKVSGFKDSLIDLSIVKDHIIYLRPVVQEIQEVVATAGENPAHRIMDLVIANRKKNHPLENDAFQYDSYSKFIFDIDREFLAKIPDTTSDSTMIRLKEFFDDQHLFLLESSSTRSFIPPSRDKEVIKAYKVSGFSDPMFSTFANELQSFSFYENQVQLLGKNYLNPIAFGGTNRYLFILQDTTITGKDTTFTIFYRPRKGKNFDGMTGHLYINTNNYAIEKVIASPYIDSSAFNLKIVQEYQFTNDTKWFPVKLSTELAMPLAVTVEGLQIIGKGSTYIKDVTFDKDKIDKGYYDNVSVVIDEDAAELKDEEWDTLRQYSITDMERQTYVGLDSVVKENKLDRMVVAMKVLAEGKIPMGYFNFDLYRLLNFNQYEGYRIGAGLETSKKLMKPIVLGGYFGWANRDKEWKYGGYVTAHLYRKIGLKLDLRFQQDLIERGAPGFQRGAFNLGGTEMYRGFYQVNMDRQRLGEVALSGYIKGNIKLNIAGNYQRVEFTKDYRFFSTDGILPSIYRTDLAEISTELTWNIREKVMMVGDQRISKGTVYPKIRFRAAKGISGIYDAAFDYYRFNVDISQSFPIYASGVFSWNLTGGQTIGDVPLFLLQMVNGTGRDWNLSVKNSFETMIPGEFYHTKQVGLFTRMDFTKFKTKAKWNEPQIALHHAIGYGEMPNKDWHSTDFRSMDKGFFEGGLIFNNILTSGSAGLGLGVFYRYGNYADSDWKKNIYPKMCVTFGL